MAPRSRKAALTEQIHYCQLFDKNRSGPSTPGGAAGFGAFRSCSRVPAWPATHARAQSRQPNHYRMPEELTGRLRSCPLRDRLPVLLAESPHDRDAEFQVRRRRGLGDRLLAAVLRVEKTATSRVTITPLPLVGTTWAGPRRMPWPRVRDLSGGGCAGCATPHCEGNERGRSQDDSGRDLDVPRRRRTGREAQVPLPDRVLQCERQGEGQQRQGLPAAGPAASEPTESGAAQQPRLRVAQELLLRRRDVQVLSLHAPGVKG